MRIIPCMSKKTTLRDLFPGESEPQVEEIADFLHGFLEVMSRIYERLERERPDIVDRLMQSRSMKGKVDSSKNIN
jgi:hypothetical protein